MEISARQLKISGTMEIPESLEFAHDYSVVITATVVKSELLDQQDGSFIQRYTAKATDINID